MAPRFVKVSNEEDDQVMELPLEEDNTLLSSTVSTLFPSSTGLKYMNQESKTWRTLKCMDGKIYPPADGSWDSFTFHCLFPKDVKRKLGDGEYSNGVDKNLSRVDKKQCTDIIVLGMAWKTDENAMREYFSQYGELAMVQLKRHPATGQSKGFGFVRFVEYGAQLGCLADKHMIDGRLCEVKIPDSKLYGDKQEVVRKVYVGGVSEQMTVDTLQSLFSTYGMVTDVYIPKPFRNFAFVTFADPEVAQGLLGKQVPCGQQYLNIQAAAPKLPQSSRQNNHHFNTGHMNHRMDYYGLQGTPDQNAVTLAALNMLKNPALLNTLMSMTATGSPNSHLSGPGLTYMGHSSTAQMDPFSRSGNKYT